MKISKVSDKIAAVQFGTAVLQLMQESVTKLGFTSKQVEVGLMSTTLFCMKHRVADFGAEAFGEMEALAYEILDDVDDTREKVN